MIPESLYSDWEIIYLCLAQIIQVDMDGRQSSEVRPVGFTVQSAAFTWENLLDFWWWVWWVVILLFLGQRTVKNLVSYVFTIIGM